MVPSGSDDASDINCGRGMAVVFESMPEEQDSGFNAGALIGTIERWLILIFVCLQRYDALGLLIAAKSIIRFSEAQNKKSEYVLAGTLLSIFIAVLAGMAWLVVHNEYA